MKQGCLEYKTIITSVADFVITFFKEKIKEGISGGIKEGISGGIKEGIKLLLYTIKGKPGKRTNELAELLQISPKTMEKWIKKLKQQERIVFKGSKKTGGYFVK
jgi:ATP-dependent DNA helicase RecG